MNRTKQESHREQLRQLADRIQRDTASVEEQCRVPTGGQANGGLSNAPLHLADVGTDEFHQEVNSALLENQQYLLDEAVAALRRLEDGTYGRCEGCGQQIADARLEAIPYTRLCQPCAAKSDSVPNVNLNTSRPVDEAQAIELADKFVVTNE